MTKYENGRPAETQATVHDAAPLRAFEDLELLIFSSTGGALTRGAWHSRNPSVAGHDFQRQQAEIVQAAERTSPASNIF